MASAAADGQNTPPNNLLYTPQTGINVFDAEGRDHGKSKMAAEAAIKDTLMYVCMMGVVLYKCLVLTLGPMPHQHARRSG